MTKSRKASKPEIEETTDPETKGTNKNGDVLAAARRDVEARIATLTPQVRAARSEVESVKEELKDAKSVLERRQAALEELCEELTDIENGQWQPKLPFAADGPEDSAGKSPISILGMTDKETEQLEEAEIATVAVDDPDVVDDIDTPEDYERLIREINPRT